MHFRAYGVTPRHQQPMVGAEMLRHDGFLRVFRLPASEVNHDISGTKLFTASKACHHTTQPFHAFGRDAHRLMAIQPRRLYACPTGLQCLGGVFEGQSAEPVRPPFSFFPSLPMLGDTAPGSQCRINTKVFGHSFDGRVTRLQVARELLTNLAVGAQESRLVDAHREARIFQRL